MDLKKLILSFFILTLPLGREVFSQETFLTISEKTSDADSLFFDQYLSEGFTEQTEEQLLIYINNQKLSIESKFNLINRLHYLDKNSDLLKKTISLFMQHVDKYGDRFRKSLSPYDYHQFSNNMSKLYSFMSAHSSLPEKTEYVLNNLMYDNSKENYIKTGDYLRSIKQNKDALSCYLESLMIEESPSVFQKAQELYVNIFQSDVSFIEYFDRLKIEKRNNIASNSRVDPNPQRMKRINDYGFGRQFLKNGGILYISIKDDVSQSISRSIYNKSQRFGVTFHSVLIEEKPITNSTEASYISTIPKHYEEDVWNDFRIEKLPVLIFMGKRQKVLFRIHSSYSQLPDIAEDIILLHDFSGSRDE